MTNQKLMVRYEKYEMFLLWPYVEEKNEIKTHDSVKNTGQSML